jgi:N-acetylglucosamine-6-sulfatase
MKNKKYRTISAIIIFFLILSAGLFYNARRINNLKNPPPNIIFILTDDLDLALMPYMENTNKLIGQEGAAFTNFFVTSSACCPSRASILRGQYPHNTGILENSPGFEQFYRDGNVKDTVALWLKRANYKTSYLGKYMNLYPAGAKRTYIPPGWTDWHVFLGTKSPDFYYAYTTSENGNLVKYEKKPEDYSTDVLKGKAFEFINKSVKSRSPFFLFISVYAPHGPSIPAPRHTDLFKDLEYPQNPSFHEDDISDKPLIIQDIVNSNGVFDVEEANDLFIKRVQTMQSVDEMVAELVQLLTENGQLGNTYIIFTSDNGFHMGEHFLPSGKMLPYEEDIRIPFLIRGPGIEPGSTVTKMVTNIDIAPTLADLAGARAAEFIDGRSFRHFLNAQQPEMREWRKAFLVETGEFEKESPVIAYKGIRTETFIYLEYESDEIEFYDLIADPHQLHNIANELDSQTLSILHSWLEEFRVCSMDECRRLEMTIPENIKY